MDELAKVEPKEIVLQENASPIMAMKAFLESGVDLEKIEKLFEIQERWDAVQAKKAYTVAMAKFKANPPEITKDKKVGYTSKNTGDVVGYSHATLGNVTSQINSSLSKYGLSSSWVTNQNEEKVSVTCKITHELGHHEQTTLSALPDNSGKKNSIQAIASTITYLERYSLLALTGLATHDQDDDGNAYQEPEYIDEKKQSTLRDMLAEINASETKFLKSINCESIATVPESVYLRAVKTIEAKKGEKPNDKSK